MTTLAIECSSSIGSIAIIHHTQVLYNCSFENPRGRGSAFFAALEKTRPHIESLDLVLVGTGPGSYNSLRASIAAAWGLARARSTPLQGICSLLGYDAPEYHVLGDARAGQWFHAHVQNERLSAPPELLPPAQAMARLKPGVPVFTTSPLLDGAHGEYPQALILARRAAQAGPPDPIYLKPPHITQPAHSK